MGEGARRHLCSLQTPTKCSPCALQTSLVLSVVLPALSLSGPCLSLCLCCPGGVGRARRSGLVLFAGLGRTPAALGHPGGSRGGWAAAMAARPSWSLLGILPKPLHLLRKSRMTLTLVTAPKSEQRTKKKKQHSSASRETGFVHGVTPAPAPHAIPPPHRPTPARPLMPSMAMGENLAMSDRGTTLGSRGPALDPHAL